MDSSHNPQSTIAFVILLGIYKIIEFIFANFEVNNCVTGNKDKTKPTTPPMIYFL